MPKVTQVTLQSGISLYFPQHINEKLEQAARGKRSFLQMESLTGAYAPFERVTVRIEHISLFGLINVPENPAQQSQQDTGSTERQGEGLLDRADDERHVQGDGGDGDRSSKHSA